MRISAVVCGRNDNYGGNLNQRASYCLNSLLTTFDEVIYVDWNGVDKTLVEEIKDNLIPTDKLRVIKISPEEVGNLTNYDRNAQQVCEVLCKNIGIRRATGDFILSTSIEDICPLRVYLDILNDKDIFYIGAKRRIQLISIEMLGAYKDVYKIQCDLLKQPAPPPPYSGAFPGDVWSIIDSCGDFQYASKELWFELRGMEEFQIYRGFYDTNVQKKVMLSGRKVELRNELPVFHIEHGGGFGGYGGVNDRGSSIAHFQLPSQNTETWGFSDKHFTEFNFKDL